jgi:hypothetical protein
MTPAVEVTFAVGLLIGLALGYGVRAFISPQHAVMPDEAHRAWPRWLSWGWCGLSIFAGPARPSGGAVPWRRSLHVGARWDKVAKGPVAVAAAPPVVAAAWDTAAASALPSAL